MGARLLDDAKRFIPAPAGNRSARSLSRSASAVHPRACGEQIIRSYTAAQSAGSSPRLRGTGSASNGSG